MSLSLSNLVTFSSFKEDLVKLPYTWPEFIAFPLVFFSLIGAIFMHISSRCIDDMKMLI